MKLPIVFHPAYSPEFDPSHRFPMEKFQLLFNHLKAIGVVDQCQWHTPNKATVEQVALAHDPSYIAAFKNNELSYHAQRRIGLPWSEGVMHRTFLAVGGSILTTELAIKHGMSAHLAGGTHHAHYDEGSGFCIFNDLAICARHALSFPNIERVMIIDADVHQGDGTARILEFDHQIVTVSIHCKQNFPARKAQSDHDIEIEHGTADADYLATIKPQIKYLLTLHDPDFVIYDAGADPHKDDALGLLNLTDDGLFKRDEFILSECAERGIPVACVIGGGYMKDRQRLAEVHSIVHQAALNVFKRHIARDSA